jgi:hypothetical protein
MLVKVDVVAGQSLRFGITPVVTRCKLIFPDSGRCILSSLLSVNSSQGSCDELNLSRSRVPSLCGCYDSSKIMFYVFQIQRVDARCRLGVKLWC